MAASDAVLHVQNDSSFWRERPQQGHLMPGRLDGCTETPAQTGRQLVLSLTTVPSYSRNGASLVAPPLSALDLDENRDPWPVAL